MKKEDLKTGIIVETRDSKRYIVIKKAIIDNKENDLLIRDGGFSSLTNYKDDLTVGGCNSLDIVKVYVSSVENLIGMINYDSNSSNLNLIWEREEPPRLTERERAYLKAYNYDYEWAVRTKSGEVYFSKSKPFKVNDYWFSKDKELMAGCDFQDKLLGIIKWEDEKPYRIKDLLGEE